MKKWMPLSLCAALLVGWTASIVVAAPDSISEQKKAQNKLLCYRAARADAIRKLAERIKGLQITSETTVKDFVTENDQIQTALTATLSGMEETSKPKYMEDGTCSVTMKVTLQEVITDLKKIHNACYKGDKFKVQDFEKMTVTNTVKEIEETGSGATRPEKAVEEVPLKEGERAETAEYPAGVKAYWLAHVTGQGRLMAVRAAHVDGLRRLAERVKGTLVESNTVVKDFAAEEDFIRLATSQFLVGAKEVGVRYHADELIVDVDMQVKLRTVYANIKRYAEEKYKGDSVKIKSFEEITTRTEDTIIKETGSGVPPEKYLKDVSTAEMENLNMAQNSPEWAGQTLRVKGSAAVDPDNENKAQAKLMAFRGAELDARRKIAEQLNGLVIKSKTTVKDFVTDSDVIKTRVLAFQQGAHVIEASKKMSEDGTATVEVEIELRPLWDMAVEWMKTTKVKVGPGGTEVKSVEKTTVKKVEPVED
jgi:hypothetical protein